MKWIVSGLLALCAVALAPAAAPAEESLPRVLMIGDLVHRQIAESAAKELKEQVKLVTPKVAPGDTATALRQLDELLGDGEWDLIYFNFGFADLHYRDPATESIRKMSKHAGGVRVTTPERYEENLGKLVERLKATGARLVWASTTPIGSSKFDNLFDPGSEVEYNTIAARVMDETGIAIIDLHAWVLENVKDKRDTSPFSYKGYALHPPVVEGLLKVLR